MTLSMRLVALFIAGAAILAAATVGVVLWRPAIKSVVVLGVGPATERVVEGLRAGLAERGWVEDRTIRFVVPDTPTSIEALRAEARDRIGRDTSLVVTLSTQAALAARDVADPLGIPLLLSPASDPVAVGLVSGTIHPGQSVTGIAFAAQEARRLELLSRLAPAAHRVWVPFDAADPSPAAVVAGLRPVADKLGLTLVTANIRDFVQLRAALDALPRDIDAVFVPPDVRISGNTRAVAAAAAAAPRHLPVTVPQRDGVAQGALFSYGFDAHALGLQAARLADLILTGTPAADLPIETPDMQLAINLTTADLLGTTVPDDLLRHALVVGRAGE